MKTVTLTKKNQPQVVEHAVQVLKAGGLVIFPTETVYGAGVDATNQAAVDKLLAYKSRREGKPLSIAVTDMAMAEQYVEVNEQARALYSQFLPGPMTIVSAVRQSSTQTQSQPVPQQNQQSAQAQFPSLQLIQNQSSTNFESDGANLRDISSFAANSVLRKDLRKILRKNIPSSDGVTTQQTTGKAHQSQVNSSISNSQRLAAGVASEFNTLGIRIPDYPLVLDIVKQLGRPITATSANASGKRRPYSVEQLLTHLSTKQKNCIDLIIDAGELPHRPPSTVIDTTLSTPVIFRQGALLEKLTPTTQLISNSESETQAIAGKLLLKHWDTVKQQPLVIGLNGPLGAGKTVFAKGAAQFLNITTPLVSPTYGYIEEYPFVRHNNSGTLFHIDAWKVDTAELLERLEIDRLLLPKHLVVIEWYSQIKNWLASALQASQAIVIEVTITDQDTNRVLDISEI